MSDDAKWMVILPSSNTYYALNDRTIHLLMKGKVDTNAVAGDVDSLTFSDAEISGLLEQETEVLITVVKQWKKKSMSWVSIL